MTLDITIGPYHSTPWPVVWAPVFSATGVFVVGVIAASIAYRQWRTARIKLQLDLYDKRVPIYWACKRLLISMAEDFQGIQPHTAVQFGSATAEAPFLYGDPIAKYVKDLYVRAGDHARQVSERKKARLPITAEIAEPRYTWLLKEIEELDRLFTPYLQLPDRTSRLRGRLKVAPPAFDHLPTE